MPESLFLRDPPHLLIGIAFYLPENESRWPPVWKFVFDKKKYTSSQVTLATIVKEQRPGSDPVDWPWVFQSDRGTFGEPFAVVHIGEIPWTRMDFCRFIQKIKTERDVSIPGQLMHVWSSSAWVITALYYLELDHGDELGFRLPIRVQRLFEHIWWYLNKEKAKMRPRLPGEYPPAVRLEEL